MRADHCFRRAPDCTRPRADLAAHKHVVVALLGVTAVCWLALVPAIVRAVAPAPRAVPALKVDVKDQGRAILQRVAR